MERHYIAQKVFIADMTEYKLSPGDSVVDFGGSSQDSPMIANESEICIVVWKHLSDGIGRRRQCLSVDNEIKRDRNLQCLSISRCRSAKRNSRNKKQSNKFLHSISGCERTLWEQVSFWDQVEERRD